LEVERARVTRILAKIKEDEGNVNEAADIMQDLQVTNLDRTGTESYIT
jgi:26S proteasome regulatory subunit N5